MVLGFGKEIERLIEWIENDKRKQAELAQVMDGGTDQTEIATRSRRTNLNHWGIGRDRNENWQLFHRKSDTSLWRLKGKAEIAPGLMHIILMLIAKNGGSVEKSELVPKFATASKTDQETMEGRVSPTLSNDPR